MSISEEAANLVLKQAHLFDKVKRVLVNFKKDGDDRKTRPYFETRLGNLDTTQADFETNHHLVILSDLPKDHTYYAEDAYDQFDTEYSKAVDAIKDAREAKFPSFVANPVTAPPQQNANAPAQQIGQGGGRNVRLPKISVPVFSGKYTDWPAFYDTFTRLIDSNPDIDASEKFHHLKSALPDGVDTDLRNLQSTAANYTHAWETLQNRYNNKRVMFKHFMDMLSLQPVIKSESFEQIKQLVDTSRACINALKELTIPIDQCSQVIVYFLVAKLPRETHQLWEQDLGKSTDIPTFERFTDFLTVRYRTLEAIDSKPQAFSSSQPSSSTSTSSKTNSHDRSHSHQQSNSKFRSSIKTHHISTTSDGPNKEMQCKLCSHNHALRQCSTFLKMNCIDRKAKVEQLRHCLNCLSASHFVAVCPSTTNCRTCGGRHHTLIHIEKTDRTSAHSNASQTVVTHSANHTVLAPHVLTPSLSQAVKFMSRANVLLTTAIVKVIAPDGSKVSLRALIDGGSTGSLISQRASQLLRLQHLPVSARIDLPDGQHSTGKSAVHFQVHARFNETPVFDVFATVVKSVTRDLPSRTLTYRDWPHLRGLELADPEYFHSRPTDLLIGADVAADIKINGLIKGDANEPIAENSLFGWLISGRASPPSQPTHHENAQSTRKNAARSHELTAFFSDSTHHIDMQCSHVSLSQLDSLVKEFYALEAVPTEHQYTPEEKWCRDYIDKTTVRQPNGKYMVRLPLKTRFDPELVIGRSRQTALNRFRSLERRINAKPAVREQYHQAIQEYFDLGQIEPVTTNEDSHITQTPNQKLSITCYTLPHHAVIREESLTTKCRVVYNASAITTNGKSLNDILCTGPRLQNDLPAVLLNWRLHEFVITADIGKMYRCIDLHPEDAEFHRMFWLDKDQNIKEYKIIVVTFGTASAPYTAIAILHRIADDEASRFPLASNVLKKEMYVDDMYTGSHSIDQTKAIRDQTQGALSSAGMKLHKWASNSAELLDTIPIEQQSSSTALDINSSETLKTLGMRWQPNTDQFCFKVSFSLEVDSSTITKRSVLSTTAKLFDPLGLINPIIVTAKIFLKKVWAANLGWDDVLPSELSTEWQSILTSFAVINDIRIPRWLHHTPSVKRVQLHAFCDGSKHAYASIIYMRIEDNAGHCHTSIITAKSKVTPTTSLSIPRIELCGSVISIKLIQWALTHVALDPAKIEVHYWTDATIVLAWIRGDINRWPLFVANRIGIIHTHSHVNQWHHVPTEENPADIASRGAAPAELIDSSLYWHGPEWLSEPQEKWPISDWSRIEQETPIEVQINAMFQSDDIPLIERFSSLNKMLHIVGWIMRYKANSTTPKAFRIHGPLTASEIQVSLLTLVRLTQIECFSTEIKALSRNEHVSHKSPLVSLTPFLDAHRIIRVRGRLQNSSLPYSQKHPMILPKDHALTHLLIDQAHKNTLHGGCQLTAAFLRKKFWIIHHKKAIVPQLKRCMSSHSSIHSSVRNDWRRLRRPHRIEIFTFSRQHYIQGLHRCLCVPRSQSHSFGSRHRSEHGPFHECFVSLHRSSWLAS